MKKHDVPKRTRPAVTVGLHGAVSLGLAEDRRSWREVVCWNDAAEDEGGAVGKGFKNLLDQNQYRFSVSCPGTRTFMPHILY